MSEPRTEGVPSTTPGTSTLPPYQATTVVAAPVDPAAQTEETAVNPSVRRDPAVTASPTYVPRKASAAAAHSTGTTEATTVVPTPAPTTAAPTPGRAAPEPVSRSATPPVRVRRTRKARLRIARVDPWSVMKTALLFGIAGGIIFVVATYVVMSVIESTGVYQAINQVVGSMLTSPTDTTPFSIETYINTRRVTGLAALIGAVDVVIFTALATVFSFLYNLSATMLGGLEITLAED